MGRGSYKEVDASLDCFTVDQVATHCDRTDRWIIIDGLIYDVTSWARKHPGGEKIISGHAGHDASVSDRMYRTGIVEYN